MRAMPLAWTKSLRRSDFLLVNAGKCPVAGMPFVSVLALQSQATTSNSQ